MKSAIIIKANGKEIAVSPALYGEMKKFFHRFKRTSEIGFGQEWIALSAVLWLRDKGKEVLADRIEEEVKFNGLFFNEYGILSRGCIEGIILHKFPDGSFFEAPYEEYKEELYETTLTVMKEWE